ncbi:MAG TPA: PQQ-binding-like beta-propeller repeat protein [Methanocella sp.]|nr:PQQ-binding-like beta-propeller repeat protein [Methanocella sp.]
MRKAILALSMVLLALVPAQALASGDWASFGNGPQHMSYANESLTPPLGFSWTRSADNEIIGSPLVSGNTVYYTDGSPNSGDLIAVDLSTGNTIWSYHVDGAVEGTPALANGSVIFGSYDENISSVRASDGHLLWKSQLSDGMYSSPLIYDGRVYVGTDGSDFYALNLDSGSTAWKLSDNTTQGSPAGDNGKVFIGVENGTVYALDAATGKAAWAYNTTSYIHSSPMIYDGKVFISTRDSGRLFALDETTGKPVWTSDLGYKTDATPSVDPATGTVFIGTYGGYAKAYSAANGTLLWVSRYYGPIYSNIAVSGSTVYGVTQAGKLFALNAADGSEQWTTDLKGETFASPVVADGHLVIGTISKELIAFNATSVQAAPTGRDATTSTVSANNNTTMMPEASGSPNGTTQQTTPFPGIAVSIAAFGVAFFAAATRYRSDKGK